MKFKFAIVEEQRREAQPGLSGKCQSCGGVMLAKCGQINVWHWAHRGTRTCDRWWEPQTEWHRAWKDQFPSDWQEIPQWSDDGEKHVADVKTDRGIVLEIQRSHLRKEERESREKFYQNMVWVVYGLRRVRDRPRFFASLTATSIVKAKPLTFSLPSDECALLRDWVGSRCPVFFDFADNSDPGDPLSVDVLWRLDPRSPNGEAHLSPVLRYSFLDKYLKGSPLKGMDWSVEVGRAFGVAGYMMHQPPRSRPLAGFERYMARRRRTRSRF